MENLDDFSYARFCGPQNLNKALHTLEGILQGIEFDSEINAREIHELREWCDDHSRYKKLNPFNEIISIIDSALEDDVLDAEEMKDIEWYLNRALSSSHFYDSVTSDLQRLQGLLHGILADREVNDSEIKALSDWMDEREYLSGCYPYDEIYSLITSFLQDGKIDEEEAEFLKAFFCEFVTLSTNNQIDITKELKKKVSVLGICAVDPSIVFKGKVFTFTGESSKANRSEMANIVEDLGGIFKRNPTKKINYLVYGAAGNQFWAYSCFGRKVEYLLNLRKEGSTALLIHENDFWDAYEDHKIIS
ncbi:BRCT domain-containing protein [Puniceicoccaceae bacterium K14]|nr:BRCT domain-containing protein [Puniceicoccaceae bacterium K14]